MFDNQLIIVSVEGERINSEGGKGSKVKCLGILILLLDQIKYKFFKKRLVDFVFLNQPEVSKRREIPAFSYTIPSYTIRVTPLRFRKEANDINFADSNGEIIQKSIQLFVLFENVICSLLVFFSLCTSKQRVCVFLDNKLLLSNQNETKQVENNTLTAAAEKEKNVTFLCFCRQKVVKKMKSPN